MPLNQQTVLLLFVYSIKKIKSWSLRLLTPQRDFQAFNSAVSQTLKNSVPSCDKYKSSRLP